MTANGEGALDSEPTRGRHRPSTGDRRRLLARFREEVHQGTYRPPVDAVAAQLAALLVGDGLVDKLVAERRLRTRPT